MVSNVTPKKLTCPHARYNAQMTIDCTKTDDLCTHQRWCNMTGWAKLTDGAAACKAAKEEVKTDERKAAPVKKRRNKV